MSTIKTLQLKNDNWIEWLRYVSGYNLNDHCMKSLIGYNDPRVPRFNNIRRYDNLILREAPYYYFCCVQSRNSYDKNVHIAWYDKKDSSFIVDNDLIYAEILDAEQIPITNQFIDWTLPQSKNKYFNTCRNWWFASWLASQNTLPANNGQLSIQETINL